MQVDYTLTHLQPARRRTRLIFGDPWADSGDEVKTDGKKFDEQKYERKIRAPGDKHYTVRIRTSFKRPSEYSLLVGQKTFCIFLPNRRAAKVRGHLVCSNTKNNKKAPLLAMFAWLVRRQFELTEGESFRLEGQYCQRYRSPWLKNSYFSFVLLFVEFFPARFDFVFGPTICPGVSEDERG